MSMENRRMKIVAIDPMAVIALFKLNQEAPDRLVFPRLPLLPEGYTVEDMCYSDMHRAILLHVTHPDWPEVEPSEVPEFINSFMVAEHCEEYVNVKSLDEKVAATYREASKLVEAST